MNTFNSTLPTLVVLPIFCSEKCLKHVTDLKLNPVAVYENLQQPDVEKQVKSDIKSLTGIYVIINLENGNIYVGSAITGRMPNRFHSHLCRLKGNKPVAAAVLKYGLQNFAFMVAETMPDVKKREDNQELLNMENSYLQRLKPEYNIAQQAGNTFGYRHTEETRALISAKSTNAYN
jgi:excinuclease UvrABC nuclease subunit